MDVGTITESAVNGVEFDQPAAKPQRRLIVCTTPRSGSYLLSRQLIRAGIGVPHEYLNPVNADVIARRVFGVSGIHEVPSALYHAWLEENRTTPDGTFAVKIHWDQMEENPQVLDRWFRQPGTVCLFLHRRRLLSQAVSFRASVLSGVWDIGEDVSTQPRSVRLLGEQRETDQFAYRLLSWNGMWRFFFEANGVPVVDLAYEDLVADQTAAIGSVARALGLDCEIPPPEPFTGSGTRARDDSRQRYVESWRFSEAASAETLGYVRRLTAASLVDAARRGAGDIRRLVPLPRR